jgi:polyhydroxyalkanoate synthase
VAGQAARNPHLVGAHVLGFIKEASNIIRGCSDLAPDPKDRRFRDVTWSRNPLYRCSLQFWLATRAGIIECLDDIEMDKTERIRALLLCNIVIDSLSPTNSLIGNPAALKQIYETGGASLLHGLRNAYDDFIVGNKLPSKVDSRGFEVGTNLATCEGAVIFRNDFMEVIQYAPLTKNVHEIPLLIVPPQINKFYVLDLTPDKSMTCYLLNQGFRVFCISWFNPGPAQESWGLEDYVSAVIEATGVVRNITRQKKLNVMGACSGGITLTTALSHLAAIGDERINSCTLQVCVLDPRSDDTDIGALLTETSVEFARSKSAKNGILSGKDLATTFAWMRPNDLIWNYYVNNYLMGNSPPAFDILHWNNDTTNLPARLHSDFLDFYMNSPFANPGTQEFMGQTLDLSRVKHDILIAAGLTDHITPWQACYRSVKMFGGNVTFVLSNSGHIQALINPPGNPKARYMSSGVETNDTGEWLETATQQPGSWWELWTEWLTDRSGPLRNAPRKLGNAKYSTLDKAPGLYVFG